MTAPQRGKIGSKRNRTPPLPAGPSTGAALRTFLWGAGYRRLHLSSAPGPRTLVVSSLAELFASVEDPQSQAAARTGLAEVFDAGLLERWLTECLGRADLAAAARELREDSRALKLERWLQYAGLPGYQIGGVRVDSVRDLAWWPESGGDLAVLWEHIHEGVPQLRFHADRAAVDILEQIRTSTQIATPAKPMIACLRLGLRRLPWRGRALEQLADLDAALLEPGGREALHTLLEAGILDAWAESVAPGTGAWVASARGLSPTIAVDRAVRSVLGKAVYPVAGVRCADVPALVQCATGLLETVCGDPGARERIRDALFGPIVLAGAPVGLSNPSEEELTRLPPAHRASLFAWLALRLPLLHVGGQVVDSSAAYLAAIATRRGRDDAMQLAAAGVITSWYRLALGGSLPEALVGAVPEAAFPALCLEMGEPPPQLEVAWNTTSVMIPEAGIAVFQAVVTNHDPVRTAVIDIDAETRPPRGAVSHGGRQTIAPASSTIVQLDYPNLPGVSGQVHIAVELRHAGPRREPCATASLSVMAGFPWQIVLTTMLGWTAMVGALAFLARVALDPLVHDWIYAERAAVALDMPGRLGMCVAAVAFAVRAAMRGRVWSPRLPDASARPRKIAAIIFVAVALLWGLGRSDGERDLLLQLAIGALVIQLAQRDAGAAAIFGGWLLLGPELGKLLLTGVADYDAIALLTTRVIGADGSPGPRAVAGWGVCGGLLGLAFGAAVALRGVRRPRSAELVRLVLLGVAALVIAGLGTRGL